MKANQDLLSPPFSDCNATICHCYLELGVALVLLDLDGLGVLSSSRQKEVFDLLNLLRHLENLFSFLSLT